MVGAEAFG